MAHPKREEVRQRYHRCCGYCGVSEMEVGGELTVDHFRPVAAGGNDSDDNLIYACFRCNLYKGDFFPTREDLEHGHRVLHPLLDDLSVHFQQNEQTGLLEPLTDEGAFHISLLRLNRPQLIENRLQRKLMQLLLDTRDILQAENNTLRRCISAMENYLQRLLADGQD